MIIEGLTSAASKAMMGKMEDEIRSAINSKIGYVWDLDEVRRRCRLVRYSHSSVEVLLIDGEPVLEIYPPEFGPLVNDGEKITQQITRKFRRLPTIEGEKQ